MSHGARVRRLALLAAAAVVAVLLVPRGAWACPSCFGAEIDSPMAEGMNNGVLVLLGVIGGVQGGFVAFFVGLRRRARKLQERRERFEVIDGGGR